MNRKRGFLPNGERWNSRDWGLAKQRAKASLDPICALCHVAIDMDGKPFEPMSCEIDHIVPVARGGHPYELSNLQLTHSRCNRVKGKKMAGDYQYKTADNPLPISSNW